jgi:prophage regulatory protein
MVVRMHGASKMRFLKDAEVASLIGAGISTVWAMTAHDPDFPKPIRLGPRMTRWIDDEITGWQEAQLS